MLTEERLNGMVNHIHRVADNDARYALARHHVDEMADEIKRLRAELAAMTERLDLANRRLGELAHTPIMDELNEAKRELARYKTPNVDEMEVKS